MTASQQAKKKTVNEQIVLKRWDKITSTKHESYKLRIRLTRKQLLNNKGVAERLQYLGKRLSKDEQQHAKYKEINDAFIEKVYVEPVNNRRSWDDILR